MVGTPLGYLGGAFHESIYTRVRMHGKMKVTRYLAEEGETRRIYLARNSRDGFGDDNEDGGLNVIGANGFEKPASGKRG